MLREIGCPHPRLIRRDGTPKQCKELKAADWDVLWRTYFDIGAIERTPQNDNRATLIFKNSIQTDGMAMSFWMERTKFVVVKDENEIMRETQEKLLKAQQVYGLDPSLQLVIGGVCVINYNDPNKENRREKLVQLTSGQYNHMISYRKRNKWRKKLTFNIDEKMRIHREYFDEQPGPHSDNIDRYVDHILRHFNEKFEAYTQYEYALQDVVQYIDTNTTLDKLADWFIDGKETFVFVGENFIAADSEAKGYIRSKVRDLFEKMKRRRNCTVVKVDEFRTTKVCTTGIKIPTLRRKTDNWSYYHMESWYKRRSQYTLQRFVHLIESISQYEQ
ncbi:uncharacterized protein LOC116347941 isoform X1 [Contarinia nasturtii]|uniref:uncharacterized protein LOC116347941 isoform X1 n=1 Tax=Contarinia nasturtii TaxID=265458 RepID=UPI0012D39DF6|nr:uncharacterized protein LOC116347941 isoform X1 [Contarinia nasturtii]